MTASGTPPSRTAPPRARLAALLVPLLVPLLLPLLLGACGSGGAVPGDAATVLPTEEESARDEPADGDSPTTGTPGQGGGVSTSTPGTPSGPADLVVTLVDAGGTTSTWTLTCDPPGGDHPDPAGACAALAANGQTALAPVPPDQMCTEVYGGPETATVTGTWRDHPVDATFARTDGCEIARWEALRPLLQPGSGGAGT